jgi:hypothetical protein
MSDYDGPSENAGAPSGVGMSPNDSGSQHEGDTGDHRSWTGTPSPLTKRFRNSA